MLRGFAPLLLALGMLGIPGQAEAKTKQRKVSPPDAAQSPAYRIRALKTVSEAATTVRASHGSKSLSDHAQGQSLLVLLHPERACADCRTQLGRVLKLGNDLKKLNTRLVALSKQKQSWKGLTKQTTHPITVATDPTQRVSQKLRGATKNASAASLVYIDACGRERARLEGHVPGVKLEPAMLKLIETIQARDKMSKKPRCNPPKKRRGMPL